MYIKEKQTGKVWSNSNYVSNKEGDFKVTYGFGYANYVNRCNDFLTETCVFVPQKDSIKITLVKLKNTRADKRALKLIYYIKPVLGEDEENSKGYIYVNQNDANTLIVQNLGSTEITKTVFTGTSEKIVSYTGDKKSFLGVKTLVRPEAIDKVALNKDSGLGKENCIAFEFEI